MTSVRLYEACRFSTIGLTYDSVMIKKIKKRARSPIPSF